MLVALESRQCQWSAAASASKERGREGEQRRGDTISSIPSFFWCEIGIQQSCLLFLSKKPTETDGPKASVVNSANKSVRSPNIF